MTREVRAAKSTARKNTTSRMGPPGRRLITLGRKMNIRPGPLLFSCSPATAIAGMMTRAASMAARVSNTAVWMEERGMSSSFFR